MDTQGKFYIGRLHDLKSNKTSTTPVLYDPADLTTHGVVFGMTGSGKTGLCINILEEAALQGIPALMIDPKGDITNILLHFPELRPADFQPWVNPDEARRVGKTVAQSAADTAAFWAKGLADWGITPERIRALSEAAEFAVYTPGSDAGLPVSILASLQAPDLGWDENKEIIRERIASTATAILGLVGFENIDPVQSREHILLANLFEQAWSSGQDLELGDLIRQVQNPPLKKLGVLDIDQFFPPKDRGALALRLNSILAAPSFQTWLEGEPLEIEGLLFNKQGKPRHSVFLLSHLSDTERMFFVTLLYSAVETWMRSQPGTSALRAIVYFDEIHGYLPPVAEPPSKAPMLRLLKQARAFGVGQLLATQNPVDVDYKALSNAGSWFIGKLQAERDKERLLDGLEGAAQGSFKRADYDRMISSLDKRVFLMHNVHEGKPIVFYTRWAMNYLAGPLTRNQIPALNALAKAGASKPKTETKEDAMSTFDSSMSSSRPAVPSGAQEVFLPVRLSLEAAAAESKRELPADAKRTGLGYRAGLIGQAQVRYLQRKYNLDFEAKKTALVPDVPDRGVRWDDFESGPLDERKLEDRPQDDAGFGELNGVLANESQLKLLERDFADWAYRSSEAQMWANEDLKVYGPPELSKEQFLEQCQKESQTLREAEVDKTKDKYEVKLKALQRKLDKEKVEMAGDQEQAGQRRMEEIGTHLENVLGLFTGSRRRLTTSLTKHRLASEAQSQVEESKQTIAELEKEMQEIGEEIQDGLDDIHSRWDQSTQNVSQVPLAPARSDVYVSLFGIAWLPYHLVDVGGRQVEIPAF